MQRLSINQEIDEPLSKEWIVRTDRDSNAYTAMPTSVRSFSQTSSMRARTNAFLRQINSKSAMKVINQNPEKSFNIMSSLNADKRAFQELKGKRPSTNLMNQSIEVVSKDNGVLFD